MNETLKWFLLGLVSLVWFYVVARVITRAVLRTLDERRRKDGR